VRALLMDGQACILYGAAEFSRDIDVAVLAEPKNLDRLQHALDSLRAEPVFVPPLSRDVLLRGHACHFRLHDPDVQGLRVDIMSVLHGCDPFPALWRRRTKVDLPSVGPVSVLSLPDLVQAKKTQRDKDWPMVRRLVEANYHRRPRRPPRRRIEFWLHEARTPQLLVALSRKYPGTAHRVATSRPAVRWALKGRLRQVAVALRAEETACRKADQDYWKPLREELFAWRTERRKRTP
jgi:hypothetical protein